MTTSFIFIEYQRPMLYKAYKNILLPRSLCIVYEDK